MGNREIRRNRTCCVCLSLRTGREQSRWNKKGEKTMWEIPKNLLAENGGDIIREEHGDE